MKRSIFLAITVFGVLCVFPQFAHAATGGFFGPIIPDACNCAHTVMANGARSAASAPAWGCILQVIQNIVNLIISLSSLGITLFIAYAGLSFIMNPTNEEKRTQARQRLMNAVIGLAVVLCAWLLVDSIMKALYNTNKTAFGPWNTILSATQGVEDCLAPRNPESLPDLSITPGKTQQTNAEGGPAGSGVTVVPSRGGSAALPASTATGDEAAVRAQLAAAGISINHSACGANSNGKGCTNVGGMQQATIQQLIALNRSCNGKCGIIVTGGSEPGHADGAYSHGNGYKIDMGLGTSLDSIIGQQKYYSGQRTGDGPGPGYTDKCGQNQYVKESAPPHWDIVVYAYCPTPF